jgi:hypothetical protein
MFFMMARARALSTKSPASWPYLSLKRLKWSMSIITTDSGLPLRSARWISECSNQILGRSHVMRGPPLTGDRAGESLAQAAGFSLHAGVATEAHQRNKLERVARYITRPPVAIERLSLTPQGNIRYVLKTPYRDGTTHVIFEPLDFIARLASLVPSPRVNLTRYHGVFAAHARLRAQIVPSARGQKKQKKGQGGEGAETTPRPIAIPSERGLRTHATAAATRPPGRLGRSVRIITRTLL